MHIYNTYYDHKQCLLYLTKVISLHSLIIGDS